MSCPCRVPGHDGSPWGRTMSVNSDILSLSSHWRYTGIKGFLHFCSVRKIHWHTLTAAVSCDGLYWNFKLMTERQRWLEACSIIIKASKSTLTMLMKSHDSQIICHVCHVFFHTLGYDQALKGIYLGESFQKALSVQPEQKTLYIVM